MKETTLSYLLCKILELQRGLRILLVSLSDFTDEETEAPGVKVTHQRSQVIEWACVHSHQEIAKS